MSVSLDPTLILTRVADPAGFYPDLTDSQEKTGDPTLRKKPDPDPT